jgi:formylmethanofuran dehydrogenase subunit A
VGADADVAIYSKNPDVARMFSSPRYVFKAGQMVVDDGELRRAPNGRRLRLQPEYDDALLPDLQRHFEKYSTISFQNYPVQGIPDAPLPL